MSDIGICPTRYIQNFQDLYIFGGNLEDMSKYALDIDAGHGYFNRNEVRATQVPG